MRIGLLHYSIPPVVGGVETILAKHAILMAEAGHEVLVIAGRGAQFDSRVSFHHEPLVDSIHSDVLSIKRELDGGTVSAGFHSLLSDINSHLKPLLDGLDVLIAHNVCSLHKNLALTAALRKRLEKSGRPAMILWHHDFAWTTPRYRQELHNGFPWDLIRQDWPGTIPVAVSNFRAVELRKLLGKHTAQIRVIPNGVSVTQLLGLNTQSIEHVDRLHLLEASPLILLPVRITPRKNIELALSIAAELRKPFPDLKLLVTGPPGPHNPANQEYFDRLLNLRERLSLTQHVHFLFELIDDYLPEDVVYGFFRLADLLLLPSLEEGFGLPIIESSQVKLPIFCSDITPLRELAHDEAHYFSPKASPTDAADMIAAYLKGNTAFQLRARLRRFDWKSLYMEQIEPLLREAGRKQ